MAVVPKAAGSGKKEEALRVRLDSDLRQRLEAVCEQTGQRLSSVTRYLLLAGLEQHEREQKKR